MALLNRPLTPEELAAIPKLITESPPDFYRSELLELIMEPRYQCVRYDAAVPRIEYVRFDTFYWVNESSPSDCNWMVPNLPPRRS